MHCINFIKVPFFSSFNIFDYVEGLNLGVSISGVYAGSPYYAETFDEYPTGFRAFFSGNSGSGYLFIGSGYTLNTNTYFYDLINSYITGRYTGQNGINAGFLDSGSLYSGYLGGQTRPYSSYIMVRDIYYYNTLNSLNTGIFTGNFSGSVLISGYGQYSGAPGYVASTDYYNYDNFSSTPTGLYKSFGRASNASGFLTGAIKLNNYQSTSLPTGTAANNSVFIFSKPLSIGSGNCIFLNNTGSNNTPGIITGGEFFQNYDIGTDWTEMRLVLAMSMAAANDPRVNNTGNYNAPCVAETEALAISDPFYFGFLSGYMDNTLSYGGFTGGSIPNPGLFVGGFGIQEPISVSLYDGKNILRSRDLNLNLVSQYGVKNSSAQNVRNSPYNDSDYSIWIKGSGTSLGVESTGQSNFASYWGMQVRLLNRGTINQILTISGFHEPDVTPTLDGIKSAAANMNNSVLLYSGYFTAAFGPGQTPLQFPTGIYAVYPSLENSLRIHNWFIQRYS